jgi:hypothetical protein
MFRSVESCLWPAASLLVDRAVNSTAPVTTIASSSVMHSAAGDERCFILDLLLQSRKWKFEKFVARRREIYHGK